MVVKLDETGQKGGPFVLNYLVKCGKHSHTDTAKGRNYNVTTYLVKCGKHSHTDTAKGRNYNVTTF